jgi:hypothetical protein
MIRLHRLARYATAANQEQWGQNAAKEKAKKPEESTLSTLRTRRMTLSLSGTTSSPTQYARHHTKP